MDPQLPPQLTRRSNKKLLAISGSIIVLIVAAIVVIFVLLNKQGVQRPPQIQRPGYSNVPATILDPAPLKEIPSAQAVAVQGTPIIQACNLFSLADLAQHQLYLHPNPLANFTRNYFNGQGSGQVSKERGVELDPFNSCDYPLQDDLSISLTVLQADFNTMKVSSLLKRQADIQSFTAYAQPDEDDGKTVISVLQVSKGAVSVEIRLELAKNGVETKKQQIIDTILKNLNEQIANPTGPAQFDIDSPAFQASYANACAISKAEDFVTVFGVQPAPFVNERLSTAIGAIKYTSQGDSNTYAYFESACSRYTGEEFSTDRKKLDIETRSYPTDEAAKLEMQASKSLDAGQATDQPLGDDSYIATATEGLTTKKPGSVVFRKGRIVTTLSFNDPGQKATAKSIIGKNKELETVAKAIVGRSR